MEAMARLALPSLSTSPAEAHHSGIREIANEAIRTPGAIRLDVGQPNFPTPKHIGDAGKRAIDDNQTFYTHTQGLLSLREKLVAKLERVNGIRVTPDRIACGPGGVGALAAVFGAVLEPGDEVLLPDPGWPNTRLMLAAAVATASGLGREPARARRRAAPRGGAPAAPTPRNVAVGILREADMLGSEPTGAFYCMADISRTRLHARDFVFRLLREKGVSVAPGSAFGDIAVDAVRISLASSDADLREGVGRLAEFVSELE